MGQEQHSIKADVESPGGDNAAGAGYDALLGELLDGRIEILARLGTGAMGVVYRARHRLLDAAVAVKVLHPYLAADADSLARFQREARLLADLVHPNIVHVLRSGVTADGRAYLVMELLSGSTLQSILSSEGRLDARRAVKIGREIAEALAYAAAKGIVHRDIKPGNVFLCRDDTGDETAKVVDFGMAKSALADKARATPTDGAVGSPLYMSPEQCIGARVDQRSDIYSLGCVLFEMLTGTPPLAGATAYDTMSRHAASDPKALAGSLVEFGIAPDLRALVLKCLAKEPEGRFATMEILAQSLAEVEGQLPDRPLLQRQSASRRSLRAPIIMAALVLCALALSCLYLFREAVAVALCPAIKYVATAGAGDRKVECLARLASLARQFEALGLSAASQSLYEKALDLSEGWLESKPYLTGGDIPADERLKITELGAEAALALSYAQERVGNSYARDDIRLKAVPLLSYQAGVAAKAHDWKRARALYEKLIALAGESSLLPEQFGDIFGLYAAVLHAMEESALAAKASDRAWQLHLQSGDPDRGKVCGALVFAGERYAELGEIATAEMRYRQAEDIHATRGSPARLADTILKRAHLYFESGQPAKARNCLLQTLPALKLVTQDRWRKPAGAMTLQQVAAEFDLLNDKNHAESIYKMAETAADVLPSRDKILFQAGMQTARARASKRRHQYELACRYFNKTMELKVKAGDGPGWARAAIDLGDCRLEMGDFRGAAFAFQEALYVLEKYRLTMDIGKTRHKVAGCLYQQGNLQGALMTDEQALRELDSVVGAQADLMRAEVLRFLGRISLEMENYAYASDNFEAARAICQRRYHQGHKFLNDLELALGQVYSQQGRLAEAERLLRRAVSAYVKGEKPPSAALARAQAQLADNLWRQKKLNEALPLAQSAVVSYARIRGEQAALSTNYLLRARILSGLGRKVEAARSLNEALTAFSCVPLNSPLDIHPFRRLGTSLAEAYLEQQDHLGSQKVVRTLRERLKAFRQRRKLEKSGTS